MAKKIKPTPLERLHERAAAAAAEFNRLQGKARMVAAMDGVRNLPEYNKLIADKASIRHTLHVIRVNIAKKKQAISHRRRDLEEFEKALKHFQESEVEKTAEQATIDLKLQQLIERQKARVKIP